jgi:hypothetical protein
VVAKIREKLAVRNKRTEEFDVERCNLKKLSELEDRKEYEIKISKSLQLWRTKIIVRT